ncbi:MAG TPA: ATP-binding protein [Pseudomonadales bacterium]|nr:ATP-binding protein [Pseudomonadales bacterium]
MNFNIIFLAGVHGVGKGFISDRICKNLSLPKFSASTLIKKQKNAPVDQNKNVIDAEKNQDHLIDALNSLHIHDGAILLDGHFCLSSSSGIIEVPISTFNSMQLKGVVLLTADPELIHQRLTSRDGKAMDVKMIASLQTSEIARAKTVSNILDVPLFISGQDQLDSIDPWIARTLSILT